MVAFVEAVGCSRRLGERAPARVMVGVDMGVDDIGDARFCLLRLVHEPLFITGDDIDRNGFGGGRTAKEVGKRGFRRCNLPEEHRPLLCSAAGLRNRTRAAGRLCSLGSPLQRQPGGEPLAHAVRQLGDAESALREQLYRLIRHQAERPATIRDDRFVFGELGESRSQLRNRQRARKGQMLLVVFVARAYIEHHDLALGLAHQARPGTECTGADRQPG